MIERILIKDHLSFKEVSLKFSSGLSVFTGISGAGKSVLMGAILACFGFGESRTRLIECDVDFSFEMGEFGIENESPNSFRMSRDKSVRYFINSQNISKKNLNEIVKSHIRYLSVKESDEFRNENLLNLLDGLIKDKTHKENLANLREIFREFSEVKRELFRINEEELKLEELKEFAKFEISKIESINPKIGELEELMELKKKLSKIDRINEAWREVEQIFSFESRVINALNLSEVDASFFEDAMNELRSAKESLNLDELESIDIEKTLDRIESLSSLEKRYGSIENALKALESKRAELKEYENIEFIKTELESKFKALKSSALNLAKDIKIRRESAKKTLENMLNSYLKELYMSDIKVTILDKELDENGIDEIGFEISDISIKNLSSGEFNRLRLAFIATSLDIIGASNGVLILDEIDANLSGKEAMSIAKVLVKISKFYQIFAISHLPQLSSVANSHFLVTKKGEISEVKELNESEKVTELARMISGEIISKEALEFAKKLRNS